MPIAVPQLLRPATAHKLQAALGDLIKEGIIENTHAKRPRTVNVVNYRKNEVLRRLKG